ncbi:MAG: DJ-1/PfpI family protein [Cyanobacteria bacterium P01_A01_bin.37]
MSRTVGILIYNEVEVLDFAGPFEVFSTVSRLWNRQYPEDQPPFKVLAIAPNATTVRARGNFQVLPHHTLDDHPSIEVLIVPGGDVTHVIQQTSVIQWIADQHTRTEITASVCTGAFLLAQADVISNHPVTTHWEDIVDLHTRFPNLNVQENVRWVEDGKILTSAGISAGIDMSLHLVERLLSRDWAEKTAHQMDYRWWRSPTDDG